MLSFHSNNALTPAQKTNSSRYPVNRTIWQAFIIRQMLIGQRRRQSQSPPVPTDRRNKHRLRVLHNERRRRDHDLFANTPVNSPLQRDRARAGSRTRSQPCPRDSPRLSVDVQAAVDADRFAAHPLYAVGQKEVEAVLDARQGDRDIGQNGIVFPANYQLATVDENDVGYQIVVIPVVQFQVAFVISEKVNNK